MASREQAKKIRKMKKRGRFARFSGSSAKYAVRLETAVELIDEDKTRVVEYTVPVGPIKLPRHVVNTGRSPNPERMQQYYHNQKTFQEPLPARLEPEMAEWLGQFDEIIRDTPKENRVKLFHTKTTILWLFWSREINFFVEVSFTENYIRRSREYNKKDTAMDRLKNNRITWIEQISK